MGRFRVYTVTHETRFGRRDGRPAATQISVHRVQKTSFFATERAAATTHVARRPQPSTHRSSLSVHLAFHHASRPRPHRRRPDHVLAALLNGRHGGAVHHAGAGL